MESGPESKNEGKISVRVCIPNSDLERSIEFDANGTVYEALRTIEQELSLPFTESASLYSTETKNWLNDDFRLADIKELLEVLRFVSLRSDDYQCGVEYRDKNKPIDLGNVKQRRKGQQISPYVKRWGNSFFKSLKVEEEEMPKGDILRRSLSNTELKEIKAKLNDLATPVSQGRKSKSATWDERVGEDSKTAIRNRLDKVMNLLKQKEQDARLAAEIGNALLAKNEILEQELQFLRQKELHYEKLSEDYNDLESQLVSTRSKYMLLESQLTEACQVNKNLLKEVHEKDRQLESIAVKQSESNANDSENDRKILQEKLYELELCRNDLTQLKETEAKLRKKLEKLAKEKEESSLKILCLEDELFKLKRDMENVDLLKKNVHYLKLQNKQLLERNAAQERVQRVEASPSSEKLWAKLFMSLKTGGLLTKSVDRDEELLHDAEEILDVLKEELTKPEFISVFHYLFEKLYNKVDVTKKAKEGEAEDTLPLLLTFVLLLLEKRQEIADNKEFQQVQRQLEAERSLSDKLKVQLESSNKSHEESIALLRSEFERKFEEWKLQEVQRRDISNNSPRLETAVSHETDTRLTDEWNSLQEKINTALRKKDQLEYVNSLLEKKFFVIEEQMREFTARAQNWVAALSGTIPMEDMVNIKQSLSTFDQQATHTVNLIQQLKQDESEPSVIKSRKPSVSDGKLETATKHSPTQTPVHSETEYDAKVSVQPLTTKSEEFIVPSPAPKRVIRKAVIYFLFCFNFVGVSGLHRFYLRKHFTGLIYLLTFGLFGFGTIYDFLRINELIRQTEEEERRRKTELRPVHAFFAIAYMELRYLMRDIYSLLHQFGNTCTGSLKSFLIGIVLQIKALFSVWSGVFGTSWRIGNVSMNTLFRINITAAMTLYLVLISLVTYIRNKMYKTLFPSKSSS